MKTQLFLVLALISLSMAMRVRTQAPAAGTSTYDGYSYSRYLHASDLQCWEGYCKSTYFTVFLM